MACYAIVSVCLHWITMQEAKEPSKSHPSAEVNNPAGLWRVTGVGELRRCPRRVRIGSTESVSGNYPRPLIFWSGATIKISPRFLYSVNSPVLSRQAEIPLDQCGGGNATNYSG